MPKTLENQTLKSYAQAHLQKTEQNKVEIVKDLSEIKISNLNGFTYTAQTIGIPLIFQNIFLQNPEQQTSFAEISETVKDPNNQGFQQITDQILSTFEFINKECPEGQELQQCKLGPCCCPIGALCD